MIFNIFKIYIIFINFQTESQIFFDFTRLSENVLIFGNITYQESNIVVLSNG